MSQTKKIYLDNAATSFPKPKEVIDRVNEVLASIGGNPGHSSHSMAVEASRVIFEARESIARVINAPDSSRIVFTKNATEAINVALKGILTSGDHVITSSFEHNSVAKTLNYLKSERGIKVTKLKCTDKYHCISPKTVEEAITPNTKLVEIVHGSNVLGTIQPIKEIAEVCRSRNVLFMTDASQTIGALPFDVQDIGADIVACTGHKALLGPQGTGFLYLKESIEPATFIHGGTGDLNDEVETPDRFEGGTMNTPGIGGLGAGCEYVMEFGIDKIRKHESGLANKIIKGHKEIEGVTILGPHNGEDRVSLVTFNIKGRDPAQVGVILDEEFNLMVRTGEHCSPDAHRTACTYPEGAVRVASGIFTTEEEIDIFLDAVDKIAAKAK